VLALIPTFVIGLSFMVKKIFIKFGYGKEFKEGVGG